MGINGTLNRKLRMGLVGGGPGSCIGRVQSGGACVENRAVVVAGALISNPDLARASAADYGICSTRAYGSYQDMLDAERKLPADQRIDFVSVT
ncbi:MAG: gfo/Idh/MocA family oxidoreductase, partial [Pirellulaceae bacterium]